MTTPTTAAAMPPTLAAWSFLRGKRRLLAASAASLLLHLSVFGLLPHMVSAWRAPSEQRYDAVLIPASIEPAAVAVPRPKAAKPRRVAAARVPPPKPVEAAPEAAPVADAGNEPVAPIAEANAAAAIGPAAGSVAAEPAVAPTAAAVIEPTVPAAKQVTPADVADLPPPVELPSRISISYKASSSVTDGVADYSWKRDGNRYQTESTLQATGFFVSLFAGVMHQVSQGEVGATGLKPESFRFRRGEGEPDTVEFLRASNEMRMTRNGKPRTQPLPRDIQDTQSFLFQLAYAAQTLKSPEDRLEVMVTNARKVYRHRFRQIGTETLQTRLGPVETLHLLSEASDPEDAYEVWLSPGNYHLPVKLKFFAGRFPIELIATSIRSTP